MVHHDVHRVVVVVVVAYACRVLPVIINVDVAARLAWNVLVRSAVWLRVHVFVVCFLESCVKRARSVQGTAKCFVCFTGSTYSVGCFMRVYKCLDYGNNIC